MKDTKTYTCKQLAKDILEACEQADKKASKTPVYFYVAVGCTFGEALATPRYSEGEEAVILEIGDL